MKKLLLFVSVLILWVYSFQTAYAASKLTRFESDGSSGKIKVYTSIMQTKNGISLLEGGDFEGELPGVRVRSLEDHTGVAGKLTYPNLDKSRTGVYDLEWLFIPDDIEKYETLSGTIRVNVRAREDDLQEPEIDEPTVPSLTATTVLLESRTAYDINLNNKISGSKYRWTSSNPDIVEVNAKNGKIKAIKPGKATITCEITLPDDTVQVLKSEVVVGYDENAPVLTETVLDLEVGDKFDINLENKIAKSKYRWVSSNRKVVKVNSSNGKVTAVGVGEVYVTCTITTPDNQVIVLRCDINVTEPIKTIE